MISLTRLNNRPLVVNADLIKFIEKAPDTVITLVSGEKIVVLESTEEVMNRIIDFRRRLVPAPPPQVLVSPPEKKIESPEEFNEDDY
jgi:flagellar protein FlbD